MGLLHAFGLVKETGLEIDLEKIDSILNDAESIIFHLKQMLNDIEERNIDKVTHDLFNLEKSDLLVLKSLHDQGDKIAYKKPLDFLFLIKREISVNYDSFHFFNNFKELVPKLESDIQEIVKLELSEKAKDLELSRDFQELCNSPLISKEEVQSFFKKYSTFLKAKPHKKLRAQIALTLSEKTRANSFTPGPLIKLKELSHITHRLLEYFSSPYFLGYTLNYPEEEIEIIISIYGSLITGFASQYSHHPGAPTDSDGISDVDIGVVIHDQKFLRKIMAHGPNILKLIKYSGLYYGPIKESTARYAGPFYKIFDFLRPITFAGREDRKLGVVFVDTVFYENSLKNEAQAIVYKGKISLH